MSRSWWDFSCASRSSSAPAAPPAPAVAPMSCQPAGRLPPAVALTPAWSSLGPFVDGVPLPVVAISSSCCVRLPPHSCAPPSYCEHALVSPQRRRIAALAKSFFSRAGLSRRSLFGPGDQSGPSGKSRLRTLLPSPASVSRTRLSLPARILSGVRRVAKCGARCSSRYVSLNGAVPYSYPRKGVQSALDCRIQNAPPPLMPEKAPSASVRPAALGRPRIPPRSSACTARSPLFWLDLLARSCCAKTAGCWLVLKRTCCVEVAGCWLVLKCTCCVKVAGCRLVLKRTCCVKVAGCWLVPKRTCCVEVAGCWLVLKRTCCVKVAG